LHYTLFIMRTIRQLWVILLSLPMMSISCQNTPPDHQQFSAEALALPLQQTDNKAVAFGEALKSGQNKIILVEVWASWCSDCVKAMPWVKKMQAQYPNLHLMFVSMDKSYDKWLAGVDKHQLKGVQLWAPDGMQGAWGKSIDLNWIPRYILIDRQGRVVKYMATEKDVEALETLIKQLKP